MAYETRDNHFPVQSYMMEYLRVAASKVLSGQMLHDLEITTKMLPEAMDDMVMQLSTYVMAEEVDNRTKVVVFEVPKNAWEHFKEDHLPGWFKAKYPVKTKELSKKVTFRKLAVYPKLEKVFPHDQSKAVIKSYLDEGKVVE